MKYLLFMLITISLVGSYTPTEPKYYKISFQSISSFPVDKQTTVNSIVRVKCLDDIILIDIVKSDSICSTKTYKIKNDTIIGEWHSIQDYSYRLLFPEFEMKNIARKHNSNNHTGIIEIRNEKEWLINSQWGFYLKSGYKGSIRIDEKDITLETKSTINTPARSFHGKSTTIIKEMEKSEIHKFELAW